MDVEEEQANYQGYPQQIDCPQENVQEEIQLGVGARGGER